MTNTKQSAELRKELLDQFWSIYETDGTFQALSWLDTMKYYEEYCVSDIDQLTARLSDVL
jgi:hypothetical protein